MIWDKDTKAETSEEGKAAEEKVMDEEKTTSSEETAQTEESEESASEKEEAAQAEESEADASEKEEEKDEKNGKPDKKDEQIAELKDRIVRQMAEFDNYRKRTDKEKKQNYEIGASDFILKLLPVVDNFERGLAAISEEEKTSSFAQGIDMIYKQMAKVLEDQGVTEIDALGKEFDPAFHNAVMQQPSDEYESGKVMQVLQKGYMYKDRVLRHSMVMVAE